MAFYSYSFSLPLNQVAVSQDGCQAAIPLFLGRLGLYIEGSVSPPLPDVHIRIIAGADSQNSSTKPAEVVLETTTGEDGVFIGGPLYDDISYNVEASKVCLVFDCTRPLI